MHNSQCMARLLASSVHDLRNILAVIRESSGLAQDLINLEQNLAKKERILKTIVEVQKQVESGAHLAEAMEYMSSACLGEEPESSCDLARVCTLFCYMGQRLARGAQMRLEPMPCEEPVWASLPAMTALHSLLNVFDICASVGGAVTLRIGAERRQEEEGFVFEVTGGTNTELVIAAFTGSPLIRDLGPGWKAWLMPWRDKPRRFFLSLTPEINTGDQARA